MDSSTGLEGTTYGPSDDIPQSPIQEDMAALTQQTNAFGLDRQCYKPLDDDEDNNTQFEDSPQLVATTQQIRHLVEHLEYDCGIVEQENQHLQLQCDELNAKLKDLERKHHALQAQYVREMLSKIRPKRLENIEEHQEANINNAEPQSVDNVGNEQTEEVTRS